MEPGPLLIKIDTDGHEWEILAGMTETIKRFADLSMVTEFNPKMIRAAGRQPADLLARLEELGLAVFLLDDTRKLAYRIDRKTDWTTLMKPSGYANLFCRPRTLALHVALFSHSAALGGAERSLLELARELIDDHWCVVTRFALIKVPWSRNWQGSGPRPSLPTTIGGAARTQTS